VAPPEPERSLLTPRLRLVPIGPGNAADLWRVHNDDAVVPWYDGWRPSRHEADEYARQAAESWRLQGVHKWMAYDRETGALVGRGGLSRVPIDADWAQLHAFLPAEPWVRQPHENERPFAAHAHWLEIGWALRRERWGQGYASEIGRAGLTYAFDVLGARAVVSCTARHNLRSRAVMERIGMHYAGEIRARGAVEGDGRVVDDAPFTVCVMLAPATPPGSGATRWSNRRSRSRRR
jgi:RimJ/RimL family protein N-acetyltransferase